MNRRKVTICHYRQKDLPLSLRSKRATRYLCWTVRSSTKTVSRQKRKTSRERSCGIVGIMSRWRRNSAKWCRYGKGVLFRSVLSKVSTTIKLDDLTPCRHSYRGSLNINDLFLFLDPSHGFFEHIL